MFRNYKLSLLDVIRQKKSIVSKFRNVFESLKLTTTLFVNFLKIKKLT